MTLLLRTALLAVLLGCGTSAAPEPPSTALEPTPTTVQEPQSPEAQVPSDRDLLRAFQRFGITRWEDDIAKLEQLPLPSHPVRIEEAKRLRDYRRLFIHQLALMEGQTEKLRQIYAELGDHRPNLLQEQVVDLLLHHDMEWEAPPAGITVEHPPGTGSLYLLWDTMPMTNAQAQWLQRMLPRLANYQAGANVNTTIRPFANSQENWNHAMNVLIPMDTEANPHFDLNIAMEDPRTYFNDCRCEHAVELWLVYWTKGVIHPYEDPED